MSRLTEEVADRVDYVLRTRGKTRGPVSYYVDNVIEVQRTFSGLEVWLRDTEEGTVKAFHEHFGAQVLATYHYSDLLGKVVAHLRALMLLDDLARGCEPLPDSILESPSDE